MIMVYWKKCTLICLLLIETIGTTSIDYCKLCKKELHTLCRYKEGPSDNCIEYKKTEFLISVKKHIVDIHNDIRNHVASGQETRGALGRQPAASNMNSLQWDDELAEIAQRWADQCVALDTEMQHDQCRKTGRFDVGQNILTALTPTLDIPEFAILILNWYKQVESVLPSDIENFSGIQRGKFLIGQYTQLVWAETRFIGCGMSSFRNRNMTEPKAKYLHRLVCDYGPRGNLIGSSVYKKGIPCSKCPYGRCDPIRTSLCYGLEELNVTMKKYNNEISPEENSTYNVNVPKSINNFTEFVNHILKNVTVHLGPLDFKNNEYAPDQSFNTYEILNVLASIMQQYNLSTIEQKFRNGFLGDALKITSNALHYSDTFDKVNIKRIYELDNGEVIVDDCRHQIYECQYEDDQSSNNVQQRAADIVLPNDMSYRIFKGIWFQGRCRCNYVYRSSGSSGKSLNLFIIIIYILFKYIL